MTNSNLMEQARQGNPEAIATLLNRSLLSQNIQARVRRQQTQLLVLLNSPDTIDQAIIVPRILQGLQRLGVQGIESVQIAAQQTGSTRILWRTQAALSMTDISEPSAIPQQPSPMAEADELSAATASITSDGSPPDLVITDLAGTPDPLLLPGWSFWCGWVVLSVLGMAIAAFWSSDRGILMVKGYSLFYWLISGWPSILTGIGQGIALRLEVNWSKQWVQATAIGALANSLLHVLLLVVPSQWKWFNTLPWFPVLLLIMLAVETPMILAQWYVLRRYLAQADLWLKTMLGWTVVQIMIRGRFFELTQLGGITINRWWLLAVVNLMVSGGVMLYLLRQSSPESLKLNQFTDAMTRQLLAQQRTHVNGLLLLEWSGWTLLGWVASGVVAGILSALTFGLSGLFSLGILVSTCAALQQIALKGRMDNSGKWFKHTLKAAIAGTIIALIPSLIFGGLAFNAIMSSSHPTAGLWSFVATLGIGFLFFSLTWFGVIAIQSRFLQQQGYHLSWWIGTHLAIALAILVNRPWQELGYLLPGIVFWMVLMPSAVMVWLLGYPRKITGL
ncbi:MAG: hypothetical protein F6K61_02225 [Sphaerospermopsis sp. SIO1G1]|nr:hypothetical protein [Sphaerospermopsis sp. SIO1G1]